MPLPGMLAEVTQLKVRGLLQKRDPEILDNVPEQVAIFEQRVQGASVEVVAIIGQDPTNGAIRALAVEAIAIQTASEIEYAEYPEEQAPGDNGRGWHLHQRYKELLERLIDWLTSGIPGQGAGSGGDGSTQLGALSPRGSFPEPCPDPFGYPC